MYNPSAFLGRRLFGKRLVGKWMWPRQRPGGEGGENQIKFLRETLVDYGGSVLAEGDRVRFFGWVTKDAQAHLDCYVKILSLDAMTTDYDLCTVQVLRGPAGFTIPAKTPWVSYGQPGDGLIFLTADGVESDKSDAPYIDFLYSGPDLEPWLTTRVMRLGRLRGCLGLDPTENHIGLAIGQGGIWDPGQPHVLLTNQLLRLRGTEILFLSASGKVIGGVNPRAAPNEPGFYLGDPAAPALWALGDRTVGIDKQLILGAQTELIFNQYAGALLLGPHTKQTGALWYSSQGHKATVSGSVQTRTGRYAGTRALEFMPTATNECTDPLFQNGTGWFTSLAFCTFTQVATYPMAGTYCAQFLRTSTSGTPYVQRILVTNPPIGTRRSASVWVRTDDPDCSGKAVHLVLREYTSSTDYADTVDTVYLTGRWQRLAVTRAVTGSGRTSFRLLISSPGIPLDGRFYVDVLTVTSLVSPGSDIHGDRAGCNWTGTPHASPSTSTVTRLILDGAVSAANDQDRLTFHIWAQALRDWDEGTGWACWLDLTGSDPLSNRYYAGYNIPSRTIFVSYQGKQLLRYALTDEDHWSHGDYVLVTITHDFTLNRHELYLNRELVAWSTTAATRFASITSWDIGTNFNASEGAGWALFEFAVFHSIVPASIVGELYYLGHPLVDPGSTDYPGLYIFDGQFGLFTATSGQRMIMDAAGLQVYDGSGDLGTELGATGMILHVSDSSSLDQHRAIEIYSDTLSSTIGYLQGYESPYTQEIYVTLTAQSRDARIGLDCYADDTAYDAAVYLQATRGIKTVIARAFADDTQPYFAIDDGPLALESYLATPTTVTGYALLYIDDSSGTKRLRVKFANSVTKTIADDT